MRFLNICISSVERMPSSANYPWVLIWLLLIPTLLFKRFGIFLMIGFYAEFQLIPEHLPLKRWITHLVHSFHFSALEWLCSPLLGCVWLLAVDLCHILSPFCKFLSPSSLSNSFDAMKVWCRWIGSLKTRSLT